MGENQRNTSDEMESGLNTSADLAGRAIQKGLPSRPNRGRGGSSRPGGNSSGSSDANTAGPSPPESGTGGQSHGDSDAGRSDAPNQQAPDSPGAGPEGAGGDTQSDPGTPKASENEINAPGSDGNRSGTDAQGGGQNAPNGNPYGSQGASDSTGSGSDGNSPSQGSPDSSGGSPDGNAGMGSDTGGTPSSGAGTGAGAETGGSAAGSGAAGGGSTAVGSSAASGGAAAGSGAAAGAGAAASGATAGATAGSVAGPAGTVVGAAAGALLVPFLKLVFAAAATLVVFISFFMMHPSFLYDNSSATNDRTIIENTYNYYYAHIQEEYKNDIQSQMNNAGFKTWEIALLPIKMANEGNLDYLFMAPASYPYVSMSDTDKDKIWDVTLAGVYDEVTFEYDTDFLHTKAEYLENASSNINLVMSMIDVQKKHWFISLFEGIADSITGGLYSRFTDWVGKKWEGFWNDFIIYDLYAITVGEITPDTKTVITDPAGYAAAALKGEDTSEFEKEIDVCTIEILYVYDLKDQGVGYYADKMNLDQEQIDRATEMANYLGDLFGSHSEAYFGWYVQGGYHVDAVQGGSVGVNIAAGLEKYADEIDGMEFWPAGDPQVFPLEGFAEPPMSSAYGPRNFAPDPWHTGIDFSAAGGTPILSIADGVIIHIGQMPNGFGNYVVVYHGQDENGRPVSTMYAHMSSFGPQRAGDRVSMGETIGYVGRTGLSTGNHLHFEIHIGGSRYNPVDVLDVFEYLRP